VFSLVAEVEVHDGRGIDRSKELHREDVRLSSMPTIVRIPRSKVRAYSYSGRMIDMRLYTKLVIDDAILFDTKVSTEQELRLGISPATRVDAKGLVDPKDTFSFSKNLGAISPHRQLLTLILALVGGVVVLVNAAIGIHDQFVPDERTFVYSHYVDSDGDSSSPLAAALAASGGLGLVLWLLIRRQLRRYMEFSLKRLPTRIRRGATYPASAMFRGRSRVPLENATLRIVASNMEHGQYRRGSGTDERTVSFKEPIRAVVLYEKRLDLIPAHVPLAPHFPEQVAFDPMFDALYPPFMVSSSHGLGVHWEIQLLHPDFVDQELVCSTDHFEYEDFLPA
jgi:hypothetical protein